MIAAWLFAQHALCCDATAKTCVFGCFPLSACRLR